MITPQTFRAAMPMTVSAQQGPSSELSRVFAAAVVSEQFCDMLLRDPHQALQNGYQGESFYLPSEERDLIVSIRAGSLSDLAKQVNRALGYQH